MSDAFFPVASSSAPAQLVATDESLVALDDQIRNVVGTQRGSVPHLPHFGIDWHDILDLPVEEAFPVLVRQATEAIKRWVPRVRVTSIEPVSTDSASSARARIAWQPVVGEVRVVEVTP